jgi:hypothetical protein
MSIFPTRYSNYAPRTGYRSNSARRDYAAAPTRQAPVTVNFNAPKWVAYKAVQPVRAAWVEAKAATFEFAASMYASVIRFGDLSQKQGETVDRLAARDAEWASQRAISAPQGPAATYPNIRAAFDTVVLGGAHRAAITIGDITLSLAPATGVNAGALYVKVGAQYCGKIVGTPTGPVFRAVRECPADVAAKLAVIEADPQAAIQQHAAGIAARLAAAEARGEQLDLPCGCCGILLTDPVSRARGIGPICASKWGF